MSLPASAIRRQIHLERDRSDLCPHIFDYTAVRAHCRPSQQRRAVSLNSCQPRRAHTAAYRHPWIRISPRHSQRPLPNTSFLLAVPRAPLVVLVRALSAGAFIITKAVRAELRKKIKAGPHSGKLVSSTKPPFSADIAFEAGTPPHEHFEHYLLRARRSRRCRCASVRCSSTEVARQSS